MHLFYRLVGVAACGTVLTACADPAFYCTPDAETWRVTVLDADGEPVTDLVWTAVVLDTQDTLDPSTLAAESAPDVGAYAVFDDALLSRIDPAGDLVRVEGASGLDWFEADFTFEVPQPGECYANKVSGPDTVTLGPAPFALAATDVWGGGEIVMTSPVLPLVQVDSLLFLVGQDTVWSAEPVHDTVTVCAPMLSGAYAVARLEGEYTLAVGSVEVAGYGGAADGPPMSGFIQRWPRGALEPTFLASGAGRLQLFNAATRTVVRAFPDSIHDPTVDRACIEGIGPTYDPDAFVLCPEADARVAWRIGGQDPEHLETACFTDRGDRMAALIAPGRWLAGSHHTVLDNDCLAGQELATYLVEEPEIMRVSPRGDRVVVLGHMQPDGVLVLDPTEPIPAFSIGDMVGGGTHAGADFSPGGDVLYVGLQDDYSVTVVAVAATDGALLASVNIPDMYHPTTLLADHRGDWVYVLGAWGERRKLAVLHPGSLETVAVLEAPDGGCLTPQPPSELVLGADEGAVFVVNTRGYWQGSPPPNSCISRFDVMRRD